ncbi:MAG: hypothetical protein IT305_01835 [Chloroflexi bacterium]|nr:hypothetical protein [Chloroflexota bacterium]
MDTIYAPARGVPIGLIRAIPEATRHPQLLPLDRALLQRTTGGLVEALVQIAASIAIGLMTLLGGTVISQTETQVRPIAPPPSWGVGPLQIDPRDFAVANGPVTPYMERVTAPDPWVTP